MKNKIGYTVKVRSGIYEGVEGILIRFDTIRPFNQQDIPIDETHYDEIMGFSRLWFYDKGCFYSKQGGYISDTSIDDDEFYTTVPINALTTALYPEAEVSSDGKFYYV